MGPAAEQNKPKSGKNPLVFLPISQVGTETERRGIPKKPVNTKEAPGTRLAKDAEPPCILIPPSHLPPEHKPKPSPLWRSLRQHPPGFGNKPFSCQKLGI